MERSICAYCGEIIGVYEPIRVLLPDASERHGSLLELEAELQAPGVIVVHEGCYETFMHDPRSGQRRAGKLSAVGPSIQRGSELPGAPRPHCNLSAACAGRRLVRKV